MFFKNNKILLLVVLIAVVLRFYGIQHGFPYIFHPDEPATVRSGLGIRFSVNPGHFDWPHLYFYVNYFVFYSFSFIRDILREQGLQETLSSSFPLMWNDKLIFYLISRILTALIGIATIIPIYLFGKELFNKRVALISALTLSIIPLHVVYSHLALPDIPMVFFLCLYLYFTARIYRSPSIKNYLLAGLFLGLSASTKYNGGVAVVYLLLVHFLTFGLNLKSFKKVIFAGFSSLLGFLAGTPFALFDFDTFTRTDGLKGALWQYYNTGSVPFPQRITAFFNYFSPQWTHDYGYTVMYVFLLGLAIIIVYSVLRILRKTERKEQEKKLNLLRFINKSDYLKILSLYSPPLLFIFLISGFVRNRSHYYLIAYPFVITIFSYFVDRVLTYLQENDYLKGAWKKISVVLFTLIIFLPIFFSCIQSISKLVNKRVGPAVGGMIDKYMQEVK